MKTNVQPRCLILAAALAALAALSTVQLASAQSPLPDGFNPGVSGDVYSLAVQADGKILVGGWFSELGGQPRMSLGRLNADGTLDAGFNPVVGGGDYPSVDSLAVQPDGKILVGGRFTTLAGRRFR